MRQTTLIDFLQEKETLEGHIPTKKVGVHDRISGSLHQNYSKFGNEYVREF